MLQTMDHRFRHLLEGFCSAFTLFPPEPSLERLRSLRPRPAEEALREHWMKVGDYLSAAMEQAHDEAGETGERDPE